MQVIFGESRLLQNHAVGSGQVFGDSVQRLTGLTIRQTNTSHDTHPLGLDEDLPFVVLFGAQRVTEVIVGPAEPVAIPTVFQCDFCHLFS